MTVFLCSGIGITSERVYVVESTDGFEARAAIAFFGDFQMPEEKLEAIAYNPFHEAFNDNYACGKGSTREAAIEALKADLQQMSNDLWR